MPESEQAVVVVDEGPASLLTGPPKERIAQATEVANALKSVIDNRRLYANIAKKKYVLYEGWTTLGALVGVFPVCAWSRKADDGWEARVEAHTLSGAVVGAAEASCSRDEKNWKDRDDYALRSMAQTRAGAKALRMPLGFIMALAGYEAIPAEEIPRETEPEATPSGRWGCKECQTINDAENNKCFQCGRERGS